MRILEHNVSNIIQFRPSTSEDQIFLRIQSGQGCSASVNFSLILSFKNILSFTHSLDNKYNQL